MDRSLHDISKMKNSFLLCKFIEFSIMCLTIFVNCTMDIGNICSVLAIIHYSTSSDQILIIFYETSFLGFKLMTNEL